MAYRYRRSRRTHHRTAGWRKWAKTAVSATFKVLGIGVAAAPAIQGVKDNLTDPARIPVAVGYNYSGFDVTNPGGGINWNQLAVGVASIVTGIGLAKLGGILARHV